MSDQIAFTQEYQEQILALMMFNTEFKFAVKDHISTENFGNTALAWFYEKLADSEVHHTKTTIKEELLAAAHNKIIRQDDLDKYLEIFKALKDPMPAEADHIRSTVSQFIKTQSVKNALVDSLDMIKAGNQWDAIAEKMTLACSTGLTVSDGGHRYISQVTERLEQRSNREACYRLPVGIPSLDEILNGGLEPQQLGIVAGATGRGKSLFLQWISKTALLLGKKIVYFTLELPESAMASRFDSMLAGVKHANIEYYNDDILAKMQELGAKFGDNLIIKEYPADFATINTLKSFLMRLNAVGFVPDVVIIDYLDLMKPHRQYKSSLEEVDAMTKALHGLAKHTRTRIWTASQLNRAGIVMENPDETAVAGTISKLFTADVCVYMAQTKEEKLADIMRLIVMKNRNGLSARSVTIHQDYAYMTFYKEGTDFGADTIEEETTEENPYIIGEDDEAFLS